MPVSDWAGECCFAAVRAPWLQQLLVKGSSWGQQLEGKSKQAKAELYRRFLEQCGATQASGASVCGPFQRALIGRPLQRLSLLSSGHCCTCSSVITILCVSYSIRRVLRSRSAFCVLYLMKLHQHSGNSNAICYLLALFFPAISVSVLCFESS